MMESMTIWNNLRTPPPEVLKTIANGRLKGMTDIKPQWRYQAMTDQFGLCGFGWKYTIDNQRIEMGVGEHRFAFVDVSLFVKVDGEWSEPIPGTGGSMLIAKESSGPHMNDEAFKMATTDALSVAMSRIGVGADIYMGQAYQSKYSSPAQATNATKTAPGPAKIAVIPAKPPTPEKCTKAQANQIIEIGGKLGLTSDETAAILKWKFNKPLTAEDADFVINGNLETFATEYREQMAEMKAVNG